MPFALLITFFLFIYSFRIYFWSFFWRQTWTLALNSFKILWFIAHLVSMITWLIIYSRFPDFFTIHFVLKLFLILGTSSTTFRIMPHSSLLIYFKLILTIRSLCLLLNLHLLSIYITVRISSLLVFFLLSHQHISGLLLHCLSLLLLLNKNRELLKYIQVLSMAKQKNKLKHL